MSTSSSNSSSSRVAVVVEVVEVVAVVVVEVVVVVVVLVVVVVVVVVVIAFVEGRGGVAELLVLSLMYSNTSRLLIIIFKAKFLSHRAHALPQYIVTPLCCQHHNAMQNPAL